MIKTVLKPVLPFMLAAVLFSCNSSETKEGPAATNDSATTATVPDAAPKAFTPFDVMELRHVVKDYSKWKPLFDSDSANRKANGLQDLVVGRNLDNPNDILIVAQTADIAKAISLGNNPKLKEAMAKGGVISKPEVGFWHVVRYNPDAKENQWMEVTHKVKDYSAWLKIFDTEGTAKRAGEGLIDVVIARSTEDSNMVKLVFDISDMAKVKAAIASEEKKKTMMDAGVVGMPKIVFYKTGE